MKNFILSTIVLLNAFNLNATECKREKEEILSFLREKYEENINYILDRDLEEFEMFYKGKLSVLRECIDYAEGKDFPHIIYYVDD